MLPRSLVDKFNCLQINAKDVGHIDERTRGVERFGFDFKQKCIYLNTIRKCRWYGPYSDAAHIDSLNKTKTFYLVSIEGSGDNISFLALEADVRIETGLCKTIRFYFCHASHVQTMLYQISL